MYHTRTRMVCTIRVWYIPYAYGTKYAYGIEQCHNDATIPKVELWFQLWHCYADFEVVYTFELMTQPSENCSGAENR